MLFHQNFGPCLSFSIKDKTSLFQEFGEKFHQLPTIEVQLPLDISWKNIVVLLHEHSDFPVSFNTHPRLVIFEKTKKNGYVIRLKKKIIQTVNTHHSPCSQNWMRSCNDLQWSHNLTCNIPFMKVGPNIKSQNHSRICNNSETVKHLQGEQRICERLRLML